MIFIGSFSSSQGDNDSHDLTRHVTGHRSDGLQRRLGHRHNLVPKKSVFHQIVKLNPILYGGGGDCARTFEIIYLFIFLVKF